MKIFMRFFGLSILAGLMLNCGSIKVVDAWKSPEVSIIKDKKVLVLARTANESARIAFERDITDKLIEIGIDATPSFSKFPPLAAAKDIDDEKKEMIRDILGYEGFSAIVMTSVKDVRERNISTSNNYYFSDPWNSYYPGYYGSFYGYYYQPYVYSVSLGDTSPTTRTEKTYYLETVAFNLVSEESDQLLAVITTTIENPNDAFKIAEKYTEEIFKAIDNK